MAFITIANVEDGNTEFGAYPVRIQFYLRDSKNSSEKDAWERMYTQGYQALGCITGGWESLRDEQGKLIPVLQTLSTESDRLNQEKPCVVLSIIQNPKDIRYQNVNIREVLSPGALDKFTIPLMELDDDQLNQDDLANEVEEATLPNFAPSVEAAKAMLAPLDIAGIIEQGQASQLDLDWNQLAQTSVEQCRTSVLVAYIENAGYVASDYDLSFTQGTDATISEHSDETHFDNGGNLRYENGSLAGNDLLKPPSDDASVTRSRISDLVSSMDDGAVTHGVFNEKGELVGIAPNDEIQEVMEEALEEFMEPETNEPSFEEKTNAYVSSLTERKPIQLAIRSLDPAFKFFQSQPDDMLRQELTVRIMATNGGFQFPPF